jgi:oxalate decarboxylase
VSIYPENNSDSDGKISRRTFMKYVGAAGAIFTLSSLVPFNKAFAAGTNNTNATKNTNTTSSSQTSPPKQMGSPHTFNLAATTPQLSNAGGSRTFANADNFPILNGWAMSPYLLRLEKGGVREPHWHPNAAELSYCISGRATMTIFLGSPNLVHDTFTIDPGEIVFVPQGYLHEFNNISNEEAKFVLVFNNERPQTMGISGAVGSMPNRVMNATFGIKPPSTFFNGFNKNSPNDIVIGSKPANTVEPASMTKIPSSYKLNLEGIPPQIQTAGGTVALGNISNFPILSGLACYSLILKPNGIREPHWHPNAAELDYVLGGRARMIILSPGGSVDTFEVGPGEVVFIPPAFFHYIENPDRVNKMHMAIFFGNGSPQDIGISGGLSANSNEVLGATFDLPPTYFNNLPRVERDLFVVSGGG